MPDMTRPQGERRLPVALLVVACCVVLLVAGVILAVPLGFFGFKDDALPKTPPESSGVPGAALQRTFRIEVPGGVRDASYLVVPGDGSAESGQDLYLRFRTTSVGLEEFLASLEKTAGDLGAGNAVLGQDDIDSVGLTWKLGAEGHLAGLYADIPEEEDRAGSALVTVDESEVAAPLVYTHVTV
ncbi:hypothetical protein ABZX85_17720 [Streptomyces sp. NPDC004539]|uniref:hypothetical protein n=1 Tax=Streptomyces sp. NPDC004539 TaxID=3154280 RepID=UPI0033ADEA60